MRGPPLQASTQCSARSSPAWTTSTTSRRAIRTPARWRPPTRLSRRRSSTSKETQLADIKDPENTLVIETTKGPVVIQMRPDLAPNHVAQIKKLARAGAYDGVVFHRVIDGFMAQTGDVKFGNSSKPTYAPSRAGMGGSDKPDLKAEFSNANHGRGTCSMARAQNPNSANSQFFI